VTPGNGPCRHDARRIPLPGRARWSWLLGSPIRQRRLRQLTRLLAPRLPPGYVALDVGSGPGYAVRALVRGGRAPAGHWLLADPQRAMFTRREILATVPSLDRVVAEGGQLPIRSGSVDAALSLGVLCCMEESRIPAAVDELGRVVRPGGWLLFAVPKWRGSADESLLARAGFAPVERLRPGRGLFRKQD
jgi:SAM-dependent methyltransferase